MKIFVTNGKGRVGKDTFQTMVINIAAQHNIKIGKLSSIDYIKNIAKTFGWNGEKELKDRKMLSDLKDILTEWGDIPHKEVCKKITELERDNVQAIFIDSREPADIQRFVNEYNACTILVKRNTMDILYGNHADDEVENYNYDIIIDNSRGLKELQEEAQIFYETFIEEEE